MVASKASSFFLLILIYGLYLDSSRDFPIR